LPSASRSSYLVLLFYIHQSLLLNLPKTQENTFVVVSRSAIITLASSQLYNYSLINPTSTTSLIKMQSFAILALAAVAYAVPQVTEYTDGQPQAASATPAPVVSEYTDGQPQATAPAASVVSELSEGQPEAPSPTASAISVTVPEATASAVSVAPVNTTVASVTPTASPIATGAAAMFGWSAEIAGAAGIAALAALL
jgi:hypothetical protein